MNNSDDTTIVVNEPVQQGELIEIVTRERVRGGWGAFVHSKVTVEQVGAYIRAKHGLSGEQLFKQTKRGQSIMVSFYGTMSQIADCYEAAGEDIYQAWLKGDAYKQIPIR